MENFIISGKAMQLINLPYPELNLFSKETLKILDLASSSLLDYSNKNLKHNEMRSKIHELNSKGELSALDHRLSKYVSDEMSKNDNCDSNSEFNALVNYSSIFLKSLNSNAEFAELVCGIGSSIKGRSLRIRDKDIRSVPDKNGDYTVFSAVDNVAENLENIRIFIKQNLRDAPLLTAIIANVMFTHCHPLADGNGRTARVLFNLILNRSHENFFPLTEICHLARSGYILSVREAFFYSEWDAIINFFCLSLILLNSDL